MSLFDIPVEDIYDARIKLYKNPCAGVDFFNSLKDNPTQMERFVATSLQPPELKYIPKEYHRTTWDKSRIQLYEAYEDSKSSL
jgi:hypothetical protein